MSDAQGNPFFLTEYMRTALAQGWLRRGRLGGWTLQSSGQAALRLAEGLPLPDSIKVLFERRLVDLDDDARAVMLAAAVIGAEVPACCLQGVAPGMSPALLAAAVDVLCERQILRPHADGYAFTHDKLRETAYDLAPEAERRRVHLRAAIFLEAHRSADLDHAPVADEALAHHFEAAAEPARARSRTSIARRTSPSAAGRTAPRPRRSGRAPRAARAHARTELRRQRRALFHRRQLRKRGEARFALGEVDGCIEDSRAALALLGLPLPTTTAGWAASVARGFARVALQGARGSAVQVTDGPEAARCAGQLADGYYFTLQLTPMLAVLFWGLLWARRSNQRELVIEAQARLAYVAGVAGVRGVARALFGRAGRLAVHDDHRPSRARAQYLEALYGLGQGEWDRVARLAGAAAQVLAEAGDVQDVEIAQTVTAHAAYYRGDVAGAAAGFRTVLASARDRTNVQHFGWGLFLTARSALASGRVDEAVATLEQARGVLQPIADRSSIAICEGLLATAYARRGDLDAAAGVLRGLLPRLVHGVMPLPPCFDAYLGARRRRPWRSGAPR